MSTVPRCSQRSVSSEPLSKSSHSANPAVQRGRSEEHTSELQSQFHLVCRLLLEKKNNRQNKMPIPTRINIIKISPERVQCMITIETNIFRYANTTTESPPTDPANTKSERLERNV